MTTDLYALGMRARNAIYASFFLLGFLGLAWIPRIPEIKDSLGLSDGQFGLVLLASTVGSIPGAQIAGRAVHSYSSKIVVRISGVFLPVGVFVIGMADTVQILLLGLFITGFNVAFMDIAINGQAVEIEKHTKGRWMSSFHGFWSIGAFAATLVGGLIANFVSPRDNLIAIAAIGLFAFQFIAHYLLTAEHDGHLGEPGKDDAGKVKLVGKESLILWALGIGLMCSLIPEGGAYEWSGILLQDHMGIGKGLNAAAATTFSLAMIASRLLGDRAFEKWGHVNTVRYGGYFGGGLWGIGLLVGMNISDSYPTAGLIIVIGVLIARAQTSLIPIVVAGWIGSAYFFTSSTSFANPAITIGRVFSDTFAGIAPSSVLPFIAAQLIGAALGMFVVKAVTKAS